MRIRAITAVAVAAALIGLGTALPASAVPARADIRSGLDCTTWIHNNDPLTGGVDCTNNTNGPITFHADIVCGWAPDVQGNSVTAQPGGTEESVGHCAIYSTGIGHIGWTVE